MKKIILGFCVEILIIIFCNSCNKAIETSDLWKIYTENDGMVSNHTRGLAIDSIGNLWVGTNRGISKFDGEKWITYNRSNDPQIIKIDNNWLMFYFGAY